MDNIRTIPIPEDVSSEFWFWLIGTGADNKLTGILNALSVEQQGALARYFFAFNPEHTGVFKEPEMDDVEMGAWYKAMVMLFVMKYVSLDVLKNKEVPLIGDDPKAIDLKRGRPEKAIAISMDVSTTIALTENALNGKDPQQTIELLKLQRQVKEGDTEEDIQRLIAQDKEKYEKIFKGEFWAYFEVGVAAVSSTLGEDDTPEINNTAGLAFKVKIKGFSQEIIDKGYNNRERILVDGSRLNIAQLVFEHPECIEKVEVCQINRVKDKETDVMKGKGTSKKRILPKKNYKYVKEAVVDGILPNELYRNLFTKSPGEKILRTRGNIDMI